MNIIVIGAGLAGTSCAQALALRGCKVSVLAHGGGASELPVGLLAAHLSSQDIELSKLSRIGLAHTLMHARALLREGVDWQPCELEQKLLFHPEKNARLRQGAALLPDWYEVSEAVVRHKQAAWIKPQALTRAWIQQQGISVQTASVASLKQRGAMWQAHDAQGTVIAQAPNIVLAAGAQVGKLLADGGHAMLMDMVPGSVALGVWPAGTSQSGAPVVNGNGHFIGGVSSGSNEAIWLSGSTYEREAHVSAANQTHASLQANLARLPHLLPPHWLPYIQAQFASGQVQSWQGSRCTTSDRLPIVGELERGLYVCTAMGSRGLSFAALCAEVLAHEILPTASTPLISAEMRRLLAPKRKTLKAISV